MFAGRDRERPPSCCAAGAHWLRLDLAAVQTNIMSTPVGAVPQIGAPFPVNEISQYLIIGTGNNQTGDAINVQKTELGADQIFVSNPDPNLADVFDASGKRRWNSTTNTTYYGPNGLGSPFGNLPQSAPVFEGIDYTGQMAITSSTGGLTLSDTSVYANGFAVRCASGAGTGSGQCRDNLSSPSNSPWITSGGNQGDIGSGNGVVGNYDHSGLTGELKSAWTFISGLTAESTIIANLENGFGAFISDSRPLRRRFGERSQPL